MGEDLVERVAKALYEAMYPQERNQHLPEWFVAGDGCRDLFMRYARTAIHALREPTEAMVKPTGEVLGRYIEDSLGVSDRDAALGVWQAMIDAALSGTQK